MLSRLHPHLVNIVIVAGFIAVFLFVRAYQLKDSASGIAPEISAPTLGGQIQTLAALKQRPVLVYFWAPWCPVCSITTPWVDNLSSDYAVLSIASWSEPDDIWRYQHKEDLSMPILIDNSADIANQYGVSGVPAFFIIDKHNTIRFVERGITSSWGLRLRLWLIAQGIM